MRYTPVEPVTSPAPPIIADSVLVGRTSSAFTILPSSDAWARLATQRRVRGPSWFLVRTSKACSTSGCQSKQSTVPALQYSAVSSCEFRLTRCASSQLPTVTREQLAAHHQFGVRRGVAWQDGPFGRSPAEELTQCPSHADNTVLSTCRHPNAS